MPELYLLHESAAGYLLVHIPQWETIGQNTAAVEEAIADVSKFSQMVKFVAFHPFGNAEEALANMTAIAESHTTPLLLNFLHLHLPTNAFSYHLAAADPILAKSLANDNLSVTYHTNAIEILRGCRQHFQKVTKTLAKLDISKFQVGLGHSYSRSKIQFDPNRQDKPIMQAIALLDSLDKNINRFAMRVREWYGWHFPELGSIITDNKVYCQLLRVIGLRDTFTEGRLPELVEVCHSEEVANEVVASLKITMGQDIVESDMSNIEQFADQVIKLSIQREHLFGFLESKLQAVAPNLQALIGDVLSARLISHAGSLVNLAKYPASTIQILGAEKALFRALKSKTNTPKYGLLFQSSFIGQSNLKNKGRISRFLANKCSLAARIDNFTTIQSNVFGLRLKEQVFERMKFLTDHIAPKKNTDVMDEAVEAYSAFVTEIRRKKRREKRKAKVLIEGSEEASVSVRNALLINDEKGFSSNPLMDEVEQKKKQKKKQKRMTVEAKGVEEDGAKTETLMVESVNVDGGMEETEEVHSITKKKKKKKKKSDVE